MRKISLGTLALMVLSVMSITVANGQVCPPEMVSYWKFDEGSGNIAYDSVNGNHGTIYGATWTTGIVGGALSFDGRNDYVEVPDSDSLDYPSITNKITIETWVNITHAGGAGYPQHYVVDSRGVGGGYGLNVDTELIQFWATPRWFNFPSTIQVSTWHHVVGTYDGSEMVVYVDSVEMGRTPFTEDITPSSTSLYIGQRYTYSERFHGFIDEVAIYNRALTPEEIQQHYQNGLDGLGYCEAVLKVEIDIKPGSDPNSVNLKGKGVIPVAILTTEDFDAASVDGATVTFGPDGAKPVHGEGHLEDVNNDDELDWVGHFKTQETGIKDTDEEATITGKTKDGKEFTGKDSVNIVGGSKKAPSLNPKSKLVTTWAIIKSK